MVDVVGNLPRFRFDPGALDQMGDGTARPSEFPALGAFVGLAAVQVVQVD